MKNEINRFLSRFFILIIITFIHKILTKNSTSITNVSNNTSLDYDGILGIGWGVFAIICSGFLGIAICIFGFCTTYKVIFYFIGLTIPTLIFMIMVFTPLKVNENINATENQKTNPFVIISYLIMGLVTLALVSLLIPLIKFWTIVLVPQRVDSRSQREYEEKYGAVIVNKHDENNEKNNSILEKGPRGNILSSQPQILSISYSLNVNQNQQGDIEMPNLDDMVNKERKLKLKALKRKRNEEENLS